MRRRRSGFGWSAEQHVGQAKMYIDQANFKLEQVSQQVGQGFCLTALEAFQAAADAVGAASAALNAAEISPGSDRGWRTAFGELQSARRLIGKSCLRR